MATINELLEAYHNDPNQQLLGDLVTCLCQTNVWIPCLAIVSDADKEQVEKLLKEAGGDYDKLIGTEFPTKGEIRFHPDTLEDDQGNVFFPVFTSEEVMGDYTMGFSHVERPFMEALAMAKNNPEEPVGIVVDPYSEAHFILVRENFEIVEALYEEVTASGLKDN